MKGGRKKLKTVAGEIDPPIDVRNTNQVNQFESLLEKGPITIVLVQADWCGHCHTFKKNIWTPLTNMKNRNVNLASVHFDQLENTSQKNAKINGYPSVLIVGNDKKAATFESDEGKTNALPNANNMTVMKTLTSANVNEILSTPTNTNSVRNTTRRSLNTRNLTTTADTISVPTEIPLNSSSISNRKNRTVSQNLNMNQVLNNTAKKASMTLNNGTMPPNAAEDLITSQARNTASRSKTANMNLMGGSLQAAMLEAAARTAPAALLTAAATVVSKKKTRRARRRRGTRRA